MTLLGCKPGSDSTHEPEPTSAAKPATDAAEFGPWSSPLHGDHPLVGTAWLVGEGQAPVRVTRAELEQQLASARFVLLGETHDNADHHRLQGELITSLATDRRPAVVFEMLDPTRQAAIDAYVGAFVGEVDAFAEQVAWADSGWPEWSIYRPVFAATLAAKLPIYAAELPRAQTRLFMAEGLAMFDPALVERFRLAEPLPAELQSAWLDEMFASHCDMVPREHLGGMVEIQRLRDVRMADAMLRGAEASGQAILVAGGGHARDWAVPRLLHSIDPAAQTISVGFTAVQPELVDPRDYGDSFDVLVFTPDIAREDPCLAFKAPPAPAG